MIFNKKSIYKQTLYIKKKTENKHENLNMDYILDFMLYDMMHIFILYMLLN